MTTNLYHTVHFSFQQGLTLNLSLHFRGKRDMPRNQIWCIYGKNTMEAPCFKHRNGFSAPNIVKQEVLRT